MRVEETRVWTVMTPTITTVTMMQITVAAKSVRRKAHVPLLYHTRKL